METTRTTYNKVSNTKFADSAIKWMEKNRQAIESCPLALADPLTTCLVESYILEKPHDAHIDSKKLTGIIHRVTSLCHLYLTVRCTYGLLSQFKIFKHHLLDYMKINHIIERGLHECIMYTQCLATMGGCPVHRRERRLYTDEKFSAHSRRMKDIHKWMETAYEAIVGLPRLLKEEEQRNIKLLSHIWRWYPKVTLPACSSEKLLDSYDPVGDDPIINVVMRFRPSYRTQIIRGCIKSLPSPWARVLRSYYRI